MSKLQIYKASAGSGKTFKLTEEYLKKVLANENIYKKILSVTFTNKATEEMKNRILNELNNLSENEKSNYRELISRQLGIEAIEINQRANLVLKNILHNYSYFSVSTIDTFFQSVIQSFIKEIGLQAGFSLELDSSKILSKAIDRLFQTINSNNSLKKWMVKFVQTNIEDGKSWDIKKYLLRFSNEIFKEDFKSFKQSEIVKMADKDFLNSYISQLQAIIKSFEQKLSDIGKRAIELAHAYNLDVKDFSYGKNGVFGHFHNIRNKKKFEYGKRVEDAIDDVSKWHTKSSKRISDIETAFNQGLNQLLIEAIEIFEKQNYSVNSAKVILDRIYILGILTDIKEKVRTICQEENIFMITDSAHLLQSVINNNDSPFIFEKTGNRFSYFMIDEFQDTSGMQWNNFKPLIINSLSENKQCILVGDVKQAIYRWRNGDWKILSEQVENDIKPFETNTQILNYNWRSRKNIIEFNNSVFTGTAEILQELFNDNLIENNLEDSFIKTHSSQIHKSYADVFQQIPDKSKLKGGYIKCQFIEKDETDENLWEDITLENLISEIENLQDKNYRLKDMAILVRSKAQGEKIADYILSYQNNEAQNKKYKYDVISDEALYIKSSETVQIIILILRFLDSEEDALSKITFIYKYLEYHNLLENHEEKLCSIFFQQSNKDINNLFKEFLPEQFVENLQIMLKLPLFELSEYLIETLGLNKKSEDIHFIHAFLNLIHEFASKETADINSFLAWWDEEGNTKAISTSENQDAIKILTIHKSKGLEFKIVFVPFCNWAIDKSSANSDIIWCKTTKEPFNQLENIPLNYSAKLANTIFRNDYFEEKLKTYIDNLNLLYVAFTRAKEGLITFSSFEKTDKIKNIGNLIQASISQNASTKNKLINLSEFWNDETKCLTIGEIISQNINSDSNDFEYKITDYPISFSLNKLKLSLKHSQRKELSEENRINKIQEGIILHRLLEHIKTKSDLTNAVNLLKSEASISKENINIYLKKLNRLFENETVIDWFSDKWTVKREAPILLKSGNVKVPDRVLINKNHVIVIDYKFGELESQSHKNQIKNYVNILKQMKYSKIEAYLWYVSLEKITKVS